MQKIVLGVTGSISAYKAAELVRLMVKRDWDVRVVMTEGATKFVTPLTFQTLSRNKVVTDMFEPVADWKPEHIDLATWADAFVVAPCTANVIAKLANGLADDTLTAAALAFGPKLVIAPAMNDKMYAHPALQHNLGTLCSFPNVTVLPCAEGFLACGTTGTGRMLEPEEIFLAAERLMTEQTMTGQHVLITAGPTQEKLDPVRFISNYSTGKMGIALAEEAALRGAEVTLVLGPTALRPRKLPNLHIVDVTSALEMCDAAVQAFPKANIAILCAG